MQLKQIETSWTGTHYVYSEGTMAYVREGATGDNIYANLTEAGFVPSSTTEYSFYVELYYEAGGLPFATSDNIPYSSVSDSVARQNSTVIWNEEI